MTSTEPRRAVSALERLEVILAIPEIHLLASAVPRRLERIRLDDLLVGPFQRLFELHRRLQDLITLAGPLRRLV